MYNSHGCTARAQHDIYYPYYTHRDARGGKRQTHVYDVPGMHYSPGWGVRSTDVRNTKRGVVQQHCPTRAAAYYWSLSCDHGLLDSGDDLMRERQHQQRSAVAEAAVVSFLVVLSGVPAGSI